MFLQHISLSYRRCIAVLCTVLYSSLAAVCILYTLLALGDKSEFLIWKGDWHTEIGQVHCLAYPVSAHTCYHYLFLSTIQSSIDPIHLLAQFHPVKSFMQNSPPTLPSLASARYMIRDCPLKWGPAERTTRCLQSTWTWPICCCYWFFRH